MGNTTAATFTIPVQSTAPGGLDLSFGVDGIAAHAFTSSPGSHDDDRRGMVLTRPDGRLIIAANTVGASNTSPTIHLARNDPDSTPDTTVGAGGVVLLDLGVTSTRWGRSHLRAAGSPWWAPPISRRRAPPRLPWPATT